MSKSASSSSDLNDTIARLKGTSPSTVNFTSHRSSHESASESEGSSDDGGNDEEIGSIFSTPSRGSGVGGSSSRAYLPDMTGLLLSDEQEDEEEGLSSNRKEKRPSHRKEKRPSHLRNVATQENRVNLCEISFSGGAHRSRKEARQVRREERARLRQMKQGHLQKKRIVESSDSNSDTTLASDTNLNSDASDASDDGAPNHFLDTQGRTSTKDKFTFMTNYMAAMQDPKGAAAEATEKTRALEAKQAELNDKAAKKAADPRNAMTKNQNRPTKQQQGLALLRKMTKQRGNLDFVDSDDDKKRTLEVDKIDVQYKGCRTLMAFLKVKSTGEPYDPTGDCPDGRHALHYVAKKLGFDEDGDPIDLVALNNASTSKQDAQKKRKQASPVQRQQKRTKNAAGTSSSSSSSSRRRNRN
jgi:hypothetical protein